MPKRIVSKYSNIYIFGTFSCEAGCNMKFGYARVSKNEQSLDVQVQKLQDARCEEIFKEKISGAKNDRGSDNLQRKTGSRSNLVAGISRKKTSG